MQLGQLKRREFITLLGGAAIVGWPLAARAQQAAIPLVGFLNSGSPEVFADRLRAFNQGLKEVPALPKERMSGSCTCWAVDQYDRLPELAAELVQRRVAVIAANNAAALPAKAELLHLNYPTLLRRNGASRSCRFCSLIAGLGVKLSRPSLPGPLFSPR